jgi:hypothetical protein
LPRRIAWLLEHRRTSLRHHLPMDVATPLR